MNILVCISHVPDTTSKITFTADNTVLDTAGIQYIINPYDEIALSKAIDLTEGGVGKVTVINVGEAITDATVRKALAIGAHEAVRIDAAPRDAWFVAHQIAEYARSGSFDLILTGRESIDYNGNQVAAYVGELLDIPSVSTAKRIDIESNRAIVEREIEGGKEVLSIPLPLVVGAAEGLAEPRIPNMRGIMGARSKPLEVISPVPVPQLSHLVRYESPEPRGTVTMIDADEVEKLVALLHNKARVI